MVVVEIRTAPPDPVSFKVSIDDPAELVSSLKKRIAKLRSLEGWDSQMNLIIMGRFLADESTVEASGVMTLSPGSFVVATGVRMRSITPPPARDDHDSDSDDGLSVMPVPIQYVSTVKPSPDMDRS